MPSENNINIKWLKYLAVPFQDGFLYSKYNSIWKEPLLKVNKSLSNTIIWKQWKGHVFALPEAKYIYQTFDN